jgi:hypothetical protein
MEETTKPNRRTKIEGAFPLWVGLLLPPAAWGMQLQGLYLASEYGCATSDFTWNHGVVIVGLILSITGRAIAWRLWSKSGSTDENAEMSLRSFMSMLGVLSGALFTVTIFAQWLPTLMGVPCDK